MSMHTLTVIKLLSEIRAKKTVAGTYQEQKVLNELVENGMLELYATTGEMRPERPGSYGLTLRGEIYLRTLLGDYSGL